MHTIYIDESGHSGELLNWRKDLNQPVFTLAGLVINKENEKLIEQELCEIFNFGHNELKCTNEKLNFDLLEKVCSVLAKNSCQVIAEVVEKKYYYCTRIVDCIIKSSFEYYLEHNFSFEAFLEINRFKDYYYMTAFAEKIYHDLNEDFEKSFERLVKEKNMEDLKNIIDCLVALNIGRIGKFELQKIHFYLTEFIRVLETRSNYEIEMIIENLILKADELNNKKKKKKKSSEVFICPHISSLESIKRRSRKLVNDEVSFVHDEQKDYSIILQNYINLFEDDKVELKFVESEKSVFVQCVDLIVGILMRFSKKIHIKAIRGLEIDEEYVKRLNEVGYFGIVDSNIVAVNEFILKYIGSITNVNQNHMIAGYKSFDILEHNYKTFLTSANTLFTTYPFDARNKMDKANSD